MGPLKLSHSYTPDWSLCQLTGCFGPFEKLFFSWITGASITFRMIWFKRSERRGCWEDAQWRPVRGFSRRLSLQTNAHNTHRVHTGHVLPLLLTSHPPASSHSSTVSAENKKKKEKEKSDSRSSNYIKHGKAAELCRPVRWVSLHWLHLNSSHPWKKETAIL